MTNKWQQWTGLALGTLALAIVWGSVVRAQVAEPPVAESAEGWATLHLKNGDRLRGNLLPSPDEQKLRWSTPMFQDPLVFAMAGVERIDYRPPSSEASTESAAPVPNPVGNPLAAGFLQLLRALPTPPPQSAAASSSATDETVHPATGMRVELAGDQILFGMLTALDDQFLTIESERHGKVRLHRNHVRLLDGVADNASMMFDGTGSRLGWQSLGKGRTVADWNVDDGRLRTSTMGANLFYRPSTVAPTMYEVELSGTGKAEFQIVFGCDRLASISSGIALEAWDNELVLLGGAPDSREIRRLGQVPRQGRQWNLWLQVYFDPQRRTLEVYGHEGSLASFQVASGAAEAESESAPRTNGWLIRNRGDDLSVKLARLRRWVGPLRTPTDNPAGDLVVQMDGAWREGEVIGVNPAQRKLLLREQGQEVELDLGNVDRILFHHAGAAERAKESPAKASLTINYQDGAMLRGDLQTVREDGILVRTDCSPDPVLAGWQRLAEVRSAIAAVPEPDPYKTGLVQQRGGRLHGRIVNDESVSELRWDAVYSDQPVRFALGYASRVTFEPTANDVGVQQLFSEVTLTNGDTIPCDVIKIDDQFVAARYVDGTTAELPVSCFKALREHAAENWLYSGFAQGDDWATLAADTSRVRWRDGAIQFYGDLLLAREFDLPASFRVSFDIQWHKDLDFVLGVGADQELNALDNPQTRGINQDMLKEAAKHKPDDLIEVALSRRGRTLTVRGFSRVAGVLGMLMQQGMVSHQINNTSVALGDNAVAHIDLLVDRQSREYVVLANGREVSRWKDPTPLEGQVLHLGLGSSHVPSQLQQLPALDGPPAVAIFNFRIARWPGTMAEEELNRFLTRRVGATRKSLTHAIRAANGDCLRGRLIGLDQDLVRFQSRTATMEFPRRAMVELIALGREESSAATAPPGPTEILGGDRVLHASGGGPDEEAGDLFSDGAESAAIGTDGTARIQLWGGGHVSLAAVRASETIVEGSSPLVGRVVLPWSAVASIEFGAATAASHPFEHWVLRDPAPIPEPPAASAPNADWVGRPAPALKLRVLDGEPIELAALRGRPVVLDFWATWCGPCLASMPTMMELADAYQGQVEFFAVNLQENPEEVRDFLEARLWKLRVAMDEEGAQARMFGVEAIPCVIVIDKDGVVQHVHVGAAANLKAELTKMLDAASQ